MLKYAILFAVFSLTVAVVAPQALRQAVAPQVSTARVPADAPSPPDAASQPEAAAPEGSGFHEAVLRPNSRGQYFADVLIMGQSVPMVVDTGASFVSLSFRTASRLGLSPDPSGLRYRMATANGEVIASAATVPEISFQGIYMNDVDAIISPPEVATADLLGTSFIKRLASVEQRDGLLILRQ